MTDYHRDYMRQKRLGKYRNRDAGVTNLNKQKVYNAIVDFTLDNNRTPNKQEIDALLPDMKRQYIYNILYALKAEKQIDWTPQRLNTITIKGIVYVDMI